MRAWNDYTNILWIVCPDFMDFSYSFTELQVILWPRTNAVFTCSCRMKVLTGTTFPEKYGSRVFQTGTREGLLSLVVSFYSHSSAYKVHSNIYFYTEQNLDTWWTAQDLVLFNRSCFVHVSEFLFTHTLYFFIIYTVYLLVCVYYVTIH